MHNAANPENPVEMRWFPLYCLAVPYESRDHTAVLDRRSAHGYLRFVHIFLPAIPARGARNGHQAVLFGISHVKPSDRGECYRKLARRAGRRRFCGQPGRGAVALIAD